MNGDPLRGGRAAERRIVGIRAMLREPAGHKFEVSIEDLSLTGFRVYTIHRLALGARIWITIPTFAAMPAEVTRQDRDVYGCRFIEPLHAAVFDMIASRHRA
jgi:hypothetical protein